MPEELPIEIRVLYSENTSLGSEHWVYKLGNGYGASVVRGPGTYSSDKTFEVAVIKFTGKKLTDWGICYDTPLTSDVLAYQSFEDLTRLLVKIASLPRATDNIW